MMEDYGRVPGLDVIDSRIVTMLRENARLTWSQIGAAVGLSRVAVRSRVERLEKAGVIRGYHADVQSGDVPGGIRFTLDIETDPGCFADIIEILAAERMLQEIYGTSGHSHIHAVGTAPDSKTLGVYAGELYRTVKGIKEICWQILVITYKHTGKGVDYVQSQESEHMETAGNEGGWP